MRRPPWAAGPPAAPGCSPGCPPGVWHGTVPRAPARDRWRRCLRAPPACRWRPGPPVRPGARRRCRRPPHDRPGQRLRTVAEGLVQGRLQQRPQIGAGILDPEPEEGLARLIHEDHQVIGGVCETRMVERPVALGDHHGLPAELDRERGGDRQQIGGGGDPHRAADQPGEVRSGAGEGHRRMQGEGRAAGPGQRCQHLGAVAARGVHDQLTAGGHAGRGDAGGQRRQLIVGDAQQQHLAAFDDRGDVQQRHAGQQLGGTLPGAVGDGIGPGHRMPLRTQRRAEHGADPAGADHADAEARRGHCAAPGVTAEVPAAARAGWGQCSRSR